MDAFLLRIKRKNTPLLLIVKRRVGREFMLGELSGGQTRTKD